MTGHMVWYDPDRKPATATSPEELRALLDRIQANPEYQDIPTMAQIAAAADGQRVLQIGLGRPDYSVMLWFDKASGDALISVGVATDDDPAFDFGGTWNEIETAARDQSHRRSVLPASSPDSEKPLTFIVPGQRPSDHCRSWSGAEGI